MLPEPNDLKTYELTIRSNSMQRLLQIRSFANFVINRDFKDGQLLIEPLEDILGHIHWKIEQLTDLDLTLLGEICENLAIKIKAKK